MDKQVFQAKSTVLIDSISICVARGPYAYKIREKTNSIWDKWRNRPGYRSS